LATFWQRKLTDAQTTPTATTTKKNNPQGVARGPTRHDPSQ
jgi:hypothetical protein